MQGTRRCAKNGGKNLVRRKGEIKDARNKRFPI